MKLPAWIVCAALATPLTLAGQTPAQNNKAGASNGPQLTTQDRVFLHKMASEAQSEINLAQLALHKSRNPQVREYAREQILRADTAMVNDAEQMAEKDNADLTISPTQQDFFELQQLKSLRGQQFNQAYMSYEQQQQALDVNLVNSELTASNAQMKSYAQSEAPAVQSAAQSASQILQSIGA